MPALTELLSKPIRLLSGEEVATLNDLVVRTTDAAPDNPDIYPPVIGLVARVKGPRGSRQVFIPWDQVTSMGTDGVTLKTPALNMRQFERREGEILLEDAVLDRQVVDVEGRRVIRINDVDVAQSGGVFRLVAVDVGPAALVRRLPQGGRFSRFVQRHATTRPPLIDWAQIAPINDGDLGEVRLRVPRDRLALMQPADIARVVEQLTPKQGAALLNDLDEARAADTLEELDDEQQGQVLREMDPERAADVLEEMEPDEAADALQNITTEKAADLLGRMDTEDAADVRELLGYPEDSAGGIMTTEYVAVPDWVTAGALVDALRAQVKAAAEGKDDPLPDDLPEIYVVEEREPPRRVPAARRPPKRPVSRARGARNDGANGAVAVAVVPRPFTLWTEGKLVGVVSLRDLLLASPEAPITEAMRPPASVANPLDDEREAARLIADEDLMALPVVDDAGAMLGIVTVDDAIDVILPTAWKKRIPRRFH
jgi:CBS domain-containing protein/sporulation protein YlmC with PRC-barrel domain